MDALSDILEKIKLSSAVYFQSDFSSPWGMDIPAGPFAQFHIVTEGECLLRTPDKVVEFSAGDVVVFPHGAAHWLADSVESEKVEGMKVVQSIISGNPVFTGEEISAKVVCGHFEFDRTTKHAFIETLPNLIYVTKSEIDEKDWLKSIVTLVVDESSEVRLGNEVIIRKLGEILFIHVIRAYIEQNDIASGFLAALKDTRISSSLKLIHNSPGENWTLDSLARSVGMSRTSLSNKFKELVGETPMNYLTDWRILSAKELLRDSDMSIREVAHQIGYQSETAFIRVFKNRVAMTPLKYKKLA